MWVWDGEAVSDLPPHKRKAALSRSQYCGCVPRAADHDAWTQGVLESASFGSQGKASDRHEPLRKSPSRHTSSRRATPQRSVACAGSDLARSDASCGPVDRASAYLRRPGRSARLDGGSAAPAGGARRRGDHPGQPAHPRCGHALQGCSLVDVGRCVAAAACRDPVRNDHGRCGIREPVLGSAGGVWRARRARAGHSRLGVAAHDAPVDGAGSSGRRGDRAARPGATQSSGRLCRPLRAEFCRAGRNVHCREHSRLRLAHVGGRRCSACRRCTPG